MVVNCDSQAEIDRLWSALLADGGKEQQCGWLKDRYGLCWQIVPAKLSTMMQDPDREKSGRVMAALLKMVKLDLPALEAAYRGP
jgi:predicted 3-demethylubiquinone-9 3-methyltransferase (glyoxalase superfamily)